MERRNFLKGLFAGVTSAGVIVAASPEEIAAFASPMAKDAPLMIDRAAPTLPGGAGEHLYNSRGEVVAIIRSVDVSRDRIDMTSFADAAQVYGLGRQLRISIHAEGIGTIQTTASGIELRGRMP